MIGKLLGNRYEILEQLGGGGMAIVYKGRDAFLNRLVTIKTLRPEFSSDQDFTRRFRREAQAVASLSHPNIVSIYDVGQEAGLQYLVMEYIDGEDLKSIIRREGKLEPARAGEIARQVCDALEHAHENNIVHRDVKPHNILITKTGRAKLTDFGIAREATAATCTQTDTIVGTVHYLSPEQARGEVAGPKSDLYALGVVLYEMLTGRVPFAGDSPIAVAIKHIQEEPQPPDQVNPAVPPALSAAVMRAMQKNPDRRFASAREMSRALEDALMEDTGETTRFIPMDDMATRVLTPPVKNETKNGHRPSRRQLPRYLGRVILAAVLLGLFTGAGLWWHNYFNVPEIQVPSVIGQPEADAVNKLAALGLNTVVRQEPSDKVEAGRVIAQDIGPDSPKVKPPRTITLTVSSGQELKEVPNLYQLSPQDARARLADKGLQLADPVRQGYSDQVDQGYIYQQDPAPGKQVPPGTPVTVYVSQGSKPQQIQVPSLAGMTLDQAGTALAGAGLKLDPNVQQADSTDYPRGQVISQNPAANTAVVPGTAVQVTISRGPGPIKHAASVEVDVPNDGKKHQVRISVTDSQGTRDVYNSTQAPGDVVVYKVQYYGRGTIKVFLDNNMIKEQTVS
ncbi:Stk1 family PASTA domain-containing Ser/Thr kinase [Desulfotomaculum copahuensis]|uniref:non-specific serine/threonine protein kinase n=1 Tax=Desulfotomaculum copahuensis TaxID=1838280 RepID=A0A1B7LE85_9FIRM|nr:Stk1 family PASTA domain-containing Ser/Thr kinase [Desulfotomaculum copahuensis]OAT81411.1 protein kinase [Desulfotomaculum copahuensis]